MWGHRVCRIPGKPGVVPVPQVLDLRIAHERWGVLLVQSNQFHYRRAAFYSQLKSKVGNTLAKGTGYGNLFY